MVVTTRRTTASRSSRRGVYRQPARVQYFQRSKLLPGYNTRDKAVADTFTFSITDSAANLAFTVVNKPASDAFTFSITDSVARVKTALKPVSDTFTFSIADSAARQTLGPLVGTGMAPAKALSGRPVISSQITWVEKYVPPGGSLLVETSINNGASWQVATNGEPIPNLEQGNTTVRAILTRVTSTRVDANDPTPRIRQIDIDVDTDDSTIEYIPLGVFDFEDADISDGSDGTQISLTGLDLSGKIAGYAWESIFTQPKDKNLGDVLKAVISNRYPAATFNFASTEATAPATLTFGARDENNPWQDCLDIAEKCGMELFVDPFGVFTMQPEPDPEVGEPVWTFTDRAQAVMTRLRRRLTKSQTKNYIVVTGESSGNTIPARGVAFDDDPTSASYVLGRLGKRVLRITSKLIGDDNAAIVMARAQLLRRKNLTETVSIEAITNAAIQESDIIRVDRSASKLYGNFLTDRMSIPFDVESNMTIEARRQRLAGSTPTGGGVGGLNGEEDTGGGGSTPATTAFTVAFTSCCNASDSSAYTDIKNENPDYFFHLGDVWYDDGGSGHVAHWNAQMGAPNFAALIAALPNPPVIGWSDHDFGFANNAVGSGNSITATANAAYRSKFPNVTLPASGIYRTWSRGRVRFIYLDQLTFKSPLGTSSSTSRTMLGSTQKAWLKGLLQDSAFPVIVIIGDGQWGGPAENSQDEWRGYDAERKELKSAFAASPATIIALEGDTHSLAYAHDLNGIDRVWRASPINNNTKVKAAGADYDQTYPTNDAEDEVNKHKHYGIIDFTDDNNSITATFRGFGDGALQMTDSITVSAPGGTGGGTVPGGTSVGNLLKIGSTTGYNHFNIGIGESAGSHVDHTQAEIEAGFNQAGYFELAPGGTRARLSAHLDGGTTPGSSYPRTEFRELGLDGVTKAAWNPNASGTRYCRVKGRVTKMPPSKPQLVLLQAHDQDDDVAMVYMSSKTTVQAKLGDTVVGTLTSSFAFNTDYVYKIEVVGNGSTSVVKWFWGTTDADLVTPAFTSSSASRSSGWYFKAGCYGQSNSSTDNTSDGPFIVELSKLECSGPGYPTPVGWS
ncbi:MAG TPA: polysaccharide lyase family 7 protein [Pseudonocardia sp.]